VAAFAGNYQGGVQTPATAAHTIAITIAQNGQITGTYAEGEANNVFGNWTISR